MSYAHADAFQEGVQSQKVIDANNRLQLQAVINKLTRAQIHLADVKEHVCGIHNITKADEINRILLEAKEVLKNVN